MGEGHTPIVDRAHGPTDVARAKRTSSVPASPCRRPRRGRPLRRRPSSGCRPSCLPTLGVAMGEGHSPISLPRHTDVPSRPPSRMPGTAAGRSRAAGVARDGRRLRAPHLRAARYRRYHHPSLQCVFSRQRAPGRARAVVGSVGRGNGSDHAASWWGQRRGEGCLLPGGSGGGRGRFIWSLCLRCFFGAPVREQL